MNDDFSSAMRRATQQVRAGDPQGAMAMIQTALANGPQAAPTKRRPRTKGLGATLAGLAREMPRGGGGKHAAARIDVPEGARFDEGSFTCAAGTRAYHVFVPAGDAAPKGMVMMLHGCTQTPQDFAIGTDMNRHGQEHGLIVVYPAQARGANMQSCWNWFSPADQSRGAGEPAILAGMAQELCKTHAVPAGRVFVAGLSAGAAMAVILGQTYGDVFAGIGAHSGLPYKSAHDVASAFAAMGSGNSASAPTRPVPSIVFHGTADSTVSPANGTRIAAACDPSATEVLDDVSCNGRRVSRSTLLSGQHTTMEHWRIAGLGHAWSGGKPGGSYTDPAGPDASAEMIRFFLDLPVKGE